MGRELQAWQHCESILGKYLTDKLRSGKSIIVVANNGHIFKMNPIRVVLTNLTTNEDWCVHPGESSFEYPTGDMIVTWWEYIRRRPDLVEKVVGESGSRHRTSLGNRMSFHDIEEPVDMESSIKLVLSVLDSMNNAGMINVKNG